MADKISTKEKILHYAESLFTGKGYNSTTMRDISRAAKVNLALINYYFSSKEELYKELIKAKIKPKIEMLEKISESNNISPVDKFSKIFETYEIFYENNKNLPPLIAREVVSNTEISKWFHKNIIAKELKLIKKVFEEAQKSGIITDKFDPITIMYFCMGSMIFLLAGTDIASKTIGKEYTLRASIKEKIEIIKYLLMNGIKK